MGHVFASCRNSRRSTDSTPASSGGGTTTSWPPASHTASAAAVQAAVARYGMNPDGRTADFAVVVADAWQGRGLGKRLLQLLMDAARARGIEELEGEMLHENKAMRQLMLGMGFTISASHDEVQVLRLRRSLLTEAGAPTTLAQTAQTPGRRGARAPRAGSHAHDRPEEHGGPRGARPAARAAHH